MMISYHCWFWDGWFGDCLSRLAFKLSREMCFFLRDGGKAKEGKGRRRSSHYISPRYCRSKGVLVERRCQNDEKML